VNSEKKAARIQILVADSNAMFCELVRGALNRRRGFQVVACATSLKQLVEGLEKNRIDVALVGVHLKDEKGTGLRAVQHMRALRPQVRSVVLIESAEPHLAVEAFRAGAKGVFRRSEADITCFRNVLLAYMPGKSGPAVPNSNNLLRRSELPLRSK
jgi:DNA-binding NarL/FixJ family response regulator